MSTNKAPIYSPVESMLALMLDLDRPQALYGHRGAPTDIQFTDARLPWKEENR